MKIGGDMMSNKELNVDRDMLIFGVRYALGRQTFAPTIAIENVKHNIDNLDDNVLDILIRDVEEHHGSCGMECDKLNWMNFKHYLEREKASRDNIEF